MNLGQDWLSQCRAVCQAAKYVGEEVNWAPRPNHAGAVAAHAAILDRYHVALPGLSFLGEIQQRAWGPYQKYSLMYRSGGVALRVFMLEVYPPHKRSHMSETGDVFGPHMHLGDERGTGSTQMVRPVKCRLDTASLVGWIGRFKRHSQVSNDGTNVLERPFPDDLFGI